MSQIYGKQISDESVGLVKWDLSGSQGTFTIGTGSMIGVNDAPVNDTDLANKEYVDSVASGLDPKESVVVKSTANVASISTLLTIDGHTLTAGQRVLLTNQTDPIENGIYDAATGTWSRSEDSDGTPSNEVTLGNFTFVGTGSTWGSSGWVLGGTDAPDGHTEIQPGTHSQVWVQFSDAAALSDGAGIDITGQVVSVDITAQGGLTFSTSGASGTVEIQTGDGVEVTAGGEVAVDLLANGGLSISGSELQVDPTIAGAGSTWTSGVLNVIGSTGLTVNADNIELDGSGLAGDGISWDSINGEFDVNVSNGLSIVADTVEWGGTLTKTTTITQAGNTVSFVGGNILVDSTGFNGIRSDNTSGLRLDFGDGTTNDYISNLNYRNSVFMGASHSGLYRDTTGSFNQFAYFEGSEDSGVSGGSAVMAVDRLPSGASRNSLRINEESMTVTDSSTSPAGFEYAADYSATFTDRTLVDKEYVDGLVGGGIAGVTAGDGLTGGGASGFVTIDVVGGTGITANADEVVVDGASLSGTGITWNNVLGQFETTSGDITGVTAGAGLTGGGATGYVTLDANVNQGLSITSDFIGIGGTIDSTTTVTVDAVEWNIFATAGGSVFIGATGATKGVFVDDQSAIMGGDNMGFEISYSATEEMLFTLSGLGDANISDSRAATKGLEYSADYSAGFTNRTLVDKEYVDNQVGGGISGVTAGDGLIGGGSSGFVTVTVVGGTGITANADDIEIDFNDFSQLAGDGLTWDGGVAEIDVGAGNGITVNANDIEVTAGTGITVDGTGVNANADATLTANLVALGLTAGIDTIQEALTALLGNQTSLNSEQTLSYTTTTGDNSNTTYALVGTPATDHEVNLYVNGQLQRYGSPGTFDYYFSTGGTAFGAKAIDNVANGDLLVWNGVQAGFELVNGTDLVSVTYDEVLV